MLRFSKEISLIAICNFLIINSCKIWNLHDIRRFFQLDHCNSILRFFHTKPQTAYLPTGIFHRLAFPVTDIQQEHTLHLQPVNGFKGRKIACLPAFPFHRVRHLQAVSAMVATYKLSLSLVVKLPSAIAARAFVAGSTESNMRYHVFDSPLHGFRADGGQPLVGGCHRLFKFRSRFHGSKIKK